MPSKSICPTEALYIEHNTWLRCWFRSRTQCACQAEDLAQDTFLRVIRRRGQLQDQPLREPRAFLATIARGLLTDHWRRRELELAWQETLAQLPEESIPSPELGLVLFETLTEIDQMLDTLKPKVRQAFLLAQLEGCTCRQVAEQLGVSRATAERYLAKALRHCYHLQYEP
ncbi:MULTISPECIES: sigma-70 family RNA polymerase sigma factor [Marinobacterium]|uniref:RNA polymerase sigma-70 factor, ECF subfamily n=1 Tax=Marinobacterium iners DSM 11526 TaxID=1122198 RepID=A0A1H4G8M2_9GAMM|nr:sigma-70 family RNA polymerase sigma factor [Marinobacterium iners]SEB05621.1 RNA polymerase sigma-70 factor, ECF subfamily [Marinobacterium iners DSM 11526]